VAPKVAERKVHTVLGREVTVELMASRKSAASVKANTSQSVILIDNVLGNISDDLLFLYLDNLTELDGKTGDYTVTRNDPSQIVVSFGAPPSNGM